LSFGDGVYIGFIRGELAVFINLELVQWHNNYCLCNFDLESIVKKNVFAVKRFSLY